jgi:hypothetical protein
VAGQVPQMTWLFLVLGKQLSGACICAHASAHSNSAFTSRFKAL